ncbi:TrkH family potassium uptake protein [Spirilliplanes yamanashiensis]|uniref:Potassium transporter Trk n=1 Tax=Spirilliplanes yamanashiensis TaxID=42233 RepID=A0A8J3Y7U6_9ACTN|nr:potassium transporter TrkG [Spirilliplanes yamanashiensis]MDP9817474.1 potassium uptake TrkH family protein [Spirilliplanes yamanashiensis]GIJ02873.1 potassium transporter Trk [Spirilliplanes yamanashiensis]
MRHPARIVPLAFLAAVTVGTLLMMLPAARAEPGHAPFVTALFTATSAVCVTGLAVVDTESYWSTFGEVLITVLVQVGGIGIMTMATLLGLLVSRKLGLSGRLRAQAESAGLISGNVRGVLLRVAGSLLIAEAVITAILTLRLRLHYGYPWGRSLYESAFHAVQSVNNGGFALYPDSLTRFVGDWWMCVPLSLGVLFGSIGFPVLFELFREWRQPGKWSTHTRLTVWGTALLSVGGFAVFLVFEWSNPDTLGGLGVATKVLAAFTQDVMTRSGGFNSVDLGDLNAETIAVTNALMFIGGGSASTAGGIRVTTFLLLAFVIWAELRGEPDVVIKHRRIAEETQRQAITIALLGVALVATGTLALVWLTDGVEFDRALFEVTSAFATVGLSTGITPNLPEPAQVVLVILMYVGRVGTVAVGTAIALNTRRRKYRYPEERPLVG